MILVGKYGTRVVLEGKAKMQPGVAVSTAEAEVTAIAMASRRLLGVLSMLEVLFGPLKVLIHSDATAAIGAVKRGMSKSMGYMKRKGHAVNLAWLHEQVADWLHKIGTTVNGADVLTKPLDPESFWRHVVLSLGQTESPLQLAGKTVDEEAGKFIRRCACEECTNVTGHSGVTVARCLEVFVAQEEGQRYCSYCSGGHSGCAKMRSS